MNKSLSDKAARIISTLFVPPSFTIILFTVFAFHFETEIAKRIITIVVAVVFGFALQIILFIYMRRRGKIIDLDASVKEERAKPFLISLGFYLAGFLILIYSGINIVSIGFWFCYISNTLIVVLINRWWKISVHATGAAGPVAALLFISGAPGLWALIILLAVGWARIKLRCHNLAQVAAGSLLGFGSTYLQLYFITHLFANGR